MANLTSPNDLALLAAAQAGDHDAYETLIDRRYRSALYAVALTLVRNHDMAEQHVQTSLMRAWMRLPSLAGFNGDGPDLEGWLFTILRNSCLDELRRLQLRRMVPFDQDMHERIYADDHYAFMRAPDAEMDRADDRLRLWRAMRRLDTRSRAALILHHIEGFSLREISDLFNRNAPRQRAIRPAAIKSLLWRARATLRRELEAEVA